MNFKRWYDKYSDLQSLLKLLETVNEQNLEVIAEDFIQVLMSRYGSKFDDVIKTLNENAPPRYGRWYDDDYNLHTCIEFIKILEEDEKKELIDMFIMSVLSFVTNNDNA